MEGTARLKVRASRSDLSNATSVVLTRANVQEKNRACPQSLGKTLTLSYSHLPAGFPDEDRLDVGGTTLPSALQFEGDDEYASRATDSGMRTGGADSPTSTPWRSHEAPSMAPLGLSLLSGPPRTSCLSRPPPHPMTRSPEGQDAQRGAGTPSSAT